MSIDMRLAENVKKLRTKLKREGRAMTQEQLSTESGLSYNTIQRVETGSQPSYTTLQTLAEFFGTTIDKLTGLR